MAAHVVAAGHPVVVYDVDRRAVEAFRALDPAAWSLRR
jgi:3-hydroxyisobutyrate dehydrogenase-like beta-hydroxyacid dehydrogenase